MPPSPPQQEGGMHTIAFAFGKFNVHHKDWLTYSHGTDRPGELCYN